MNRRTNPVLDFVGRATGAVAYQPEAAADATQRLLAFLKQHL
jgi:dienelactone hydrolase